MGSHRSKQLLAAAGFTATVLVLALQFVNSSPIVVSVGDNGRTTTELGRLFTYQDAVVIAVASCVMGASGTYLLTSGGTETSTRSAARVEPEPHPREPNHGSDRGTGQDSDESPSEDLLEQRREEWEETADRLASKERDVYEAVLEADGVLAQSEIVDATDYSKATVSRALDSLETKNLVERKRRGMGNMVLLL